MTTTKNNEHKKLNFSSEREQSQVCLNSAEHEKNQGRKVLNVPNLRFKEFQGEWEKCKLGDYGKVITGNTPPTKDVENYENGEYLWASPADLGTIKSITETKTMLSAKGFAKTRTLPKGSVLVTCIGSTIGKTGMATKEMSTNQQINSIVVNDNNDNEFVYYAIQSAFPRYLSSIAVQAVPIISKSAFELLPNKKPCLQEQKRIGKFLSLLDERISTQNKIIDKLQSLIKGIRNDVFEKLRKNIGFNAVVGDVLDYEQPQSYIVEDTEYTNEGTPVLTANKAFVLGYTSETNGIYDKGDCIIFDDFTLDCKYVDFPFKVKSSAIKILTAKNKELLRYTFEFLKYLDLSTEEHKRHYIAEMQNQEIILPTEQMVKTIAHTFSTLSLRMETAVKQRNVFEKQKQYLLRQMFI